jgi:hypothetical protein
VNSLQLKPARTMEARGANTLHPARALTAQSLRPATREPRNPSKNTHPRDDTVFQKSAN